jgi:heme-degrading monooxygenase HmoA
MAYGRFAIYDFSGDENDLTQRARDGVLPILEKLDGFIVYGVLIKDGKVASMSAWDSEEHARAGDRAAKEWVQENAPEMTPTDTYFGDLAWLEFAQR